MKRSIKLGASLSMLGLILAATAGCGDTGNNYGNNYESLQDGRRSHYVSPEALNDQGDRPPLSYRDNGSPRALNDGQPGLNGRQQPLGTGMENGSNAGTRVTPSQLAAIAEAVPAVESAVVLMTDTDVAVGITLQQNGNRRIIEKQVISALHSQYGEYNYHVTADAQLYRIIQSGDHKALDSGDRVRIAALNGTMNELIDDIAKTQIRR
ncbi:YhcN/YlaJ family sporulation lipoprotein [Paenibacillus sp. CAU 1782]